jgi:hypothetical protein
LETGNTFYLENIIECFLLKYLNSQYLEAKLVKQYKIKVYLAER